MQRIGRTAAAMAALTTLAGAAAAQSTAQGAGPSVGDACVGLLDVRQVDAENEQGSVVVTQANGATLFSYPENNRGDYDVGFGTGNDLESGVLIVAPRNAARTNATLGNVGGNNGGDLYATVSSARPDSKIDMWAAVHGSPSGAEMNVDVAAVFFPFDAGFVGGHAFNDVNNGPLVRLVSSPAIGIPPTRGVAFIDRASDAGFYDIDLDRLGATGDNGVLIACGGANEDNYALVQNRGSGAYTLVCRDNGLGGTTTENDPVAFVYLPYGTDCLVAGRVAEGGVDGAAILSGTGGFAVSSIEPGRVLLTIDNVVDGESGALLFTPEYEGAGTDNIVVAEWSDAMSGYVVESRDLPGVGLESLGGGAMFSFAYVPVTPGAGFEPLRENASTIVALPDTQLYSQNNPLIFNSQTRWMNDNADELNIAMSLHLGDITNRNNHPQWLAAIGAYDLLDIDVPYLLCPGNHDVGPNGNGATRDTFMNDYFAFDEYSSQRTFGGSFEPGRGESAYSLFEAGGRKWIAIALEWGPRDFVLDWASDVLEQHSDRLGIIITHAYMYSDDTRMDNTQRTYGGSPYNYGTAGLPGGTNDGGDMWRKLVRHHPNMVMVMSGHIKGEGRLSSPTGLGNIVHEMLIDYQGRPEGGGGFLRTIEIAPDSDVMRFRTYSPWQDRSYTGTGSHFKLELVTAPGHEGWICSRADLDGDGELTGADQTKFIDAALLDGERGNWDGVGDVPDAFDAIAYLRAFGEGCPDDRDRDR